MLDIGAYTVKEATVTVPLLNLDSVEITICKISPEELLDIREKCIIGKKFNKITKDFDENIDNKKFLQMYADAVIKGWSGLKGKHLKKLMLVNLPEELLEEEVECNKKNKTELLSRSSEVDDFVTSVLSDVSVFNAQLNEAEEAK